MLPSSLIELRVSKGIVSVFTPKEYIKWMMRASSYLHYSLASQMHLLVQEE